MPSNKKTLICGFCERPFTQKNLRTKHEFCSTECRSKAYTRDTFAKTKGKKFGNLIVTSLAGKDKRNQRLVNTLCDCGAETQKLLTLVLKGTATRCNQCCPCNPKKTIRDIVKQKLSDEKRITPNVRAFIQEGDDGTGDYIDKIAFAYRLEKKIVRDILVEKN